MTARRSVRVTQVSPGGDVGDLTGHVVEPGTAAGGAGQIVLGQATPMDTEGRRRVEIVVDGWRFELTVEDAARAELRDRAKRDRAAAGETGGPVEIRAIIPGRIAAVSVTQGDQVEAGQTLLTVEAMKMQNELRAPRAGAVRRVAVAARQTVELGDLLVVLE